MANGINLEAEGLIAMGQLAKQKGDLPEAMRKFEEAANMGSGKAAYTLALLYEKGEEMPHGKKSKAASLKSGMGDMGILAELGIDASSINPLKPYLEDKLAWVLGKNGNNADINMLTAQLFGGASQSGQGEDVNTGNRAGREPMHRDLRKAMQFYRKAADWGYSPDNELENDPAYRCVSLALSNSGMDAGGMPQAADKAHLLPKMGAGLRKERGRIESLRTVNNFNENHRMMCIKSTGSSKSEVKEGMRDSTTSILECDLRVRFDSARLKYGDIFEQVWHKCAVCQCLIRGRMDENGLQRLHAAKSSWRSANEGRRYRVPSLVDDVMSNGRVILEEEIKGGFFEPTYRTYAWESDNGLMLSDRMESELRRGWEAFEDVLKQDIFAMLDSTLGMLM